jgi:maltose O-acetyltransferase
MGPMKERMLSGELYLADDPELVAERTHAGELLDRYNRTRHGEQEKRDRLLRELFGEVGEGAVVRAPLYCEYGSQITIGAGAFVDRDCILIDAAPITIGPHCRLGPRVQLLTAGHPVNPGARRAGLQHAEAITLGENVWLGGAAIVLPGITIGDDTAVGAGAVVTTDLPARIVAVGNPARIVRELGDEDRLTPSER